MMLNARSINQNKTGKILLKIQPGPECPAEVSPVSGHRNVVKSVVPLAIKDDDKNE